MSDEHFRLLGKLLTIRKEIASVFGSNRTCGSEELAIAIQKVNEIQRFLALSEEGLKNLTDLAFKVSLQKEESRYPHFQMYLPSTGFLPIKDNEEPAWMVHFDPPVTLDVATLHRISSGIPSRPYALCVWESEGSIEAHGVIRIEDLSSQSSDLSRNLNVDCYPGLILSIEEPGILNVSLSNTPRTIIEHLTLRHGIIERLYDPHITPITENFYRKIEKCVRSSIKGDISSDVTGYIGNIWSYILSLSVDFEHGGQFIILPSGSSLDKDRCLKVDGVEVLRVKHTTVKPHLGKQIAALAQDRAPEQQDLRRILGNPFTSEKLPEDTSEDAFERGVRQAKRINDKYQALFDSARAAAKLSTADGCLVFSRELQLLGFKGEVLVREDPECVVLDLDNPRDSGDGNYKEKGTFDINQFGTRHRSAARFCGKVPGAVVFVVSQDGDIRLFVHLSDKKVGVGGPFRPLPGLSPAIIHS